MYKSIFGLQLEIFFIIYLQLYHYMLKLQRTIVIFIYYIIGRGKLHGNNNENVKT
ncbi:hypothetical protein bsdtb5_26820 [Anaeromicropila herbilytica]|uniref:Uncharacterized protein n=1 Tax=Anaeromicropila herbilytica TaxID=2785025 RepID=A0A7R7IDB5_9FIRM|nr:hypothetical protein bsdtb5_26820 [Anaeromicropila herbilytica]